MHNRVQSIYIILIFISLTLFSKTFGATGKELYISRCAICHGFDARATGYLAKKSIPPTPDLTTCQFQKKLSLYPGIIISSIILRPNGALISGTLKKNGVIIAKHAWTDSELRSLNSYIISLIHTKSKCLKSFREY